MANFQRLSGQERTLPVKKPASMPAPPAVLTTLSSAPTATILPRIIKQKGGLRYLCISCQKYFPPMLVVQACDDLGEPLSAGHLSYGCWCENCWETLLASI